MVPCYTSEESGGSGLAQSPRTPQPGCPGGLRGKGAALQVLTPASSQERRARFKARCDKPPHPSFATCGCSGAVMLQGWDPALGIYSRRAQEAPRAG